MYEDLFCFVTNVLQWLPLTRAPRGFSSTQTYGSVDVNIDRLPREEFFPLSPAFRTKILAFKQFLQYFATGSDTSSCQDYEECDECCCRRELTHCKLQMNNHINFLNIRSQLILVLTSSGFYSIT